MTKSIINELLHKETWMSFLEEKDRFHRLNNKEKKAIKEIVETGLYKTMTMAILDNDYTFSTAKKMILNKEMVDKKRIVYCYNLQEQLWLKVLARKMRVYSNAVCANCFSGSANGGSKKAFQHIINDKDLHTKYAYKIDIKNYFNTIDTDLIVALLKESIDDEVLITLVEQLLRNPDVIYRDEIIQEKKGIMAGTPLSSFLANLYLKEMDNYFLENNLTYARYADDIIVFAYKDQLQNIIKVIDEYLSKYKLELNHDKTKIIEPKESFDFLGFNYNNGVIDLSQATITKTKKKIRRAARSLYRAKHKKNYSTEKVITLMIKKFNRKFFLVQQETELNWTLWYYPVINTSASLQVIDKYLQSYFRFLNDGSHTKKNYKDINYAMLKKIGYKTLIGEYYKYKK